MATFRLKIRQARLDYQQHLGRPVSIQEVATAIGISRAALSLIENEKVWPSKKALAALCVFYGLSPSDLLELDTEGNRIPLPLAA